MRSGDIRRWMSILSVLLMVCGSRTVILAQEPSNEGPGGGSTQGAAGGQVGGGPANPTARKTSRSIRRSVQPSSASTGRRNPSSKKPPPQPEESLADKVESALEEGNAARDRHLYSEAESRYRQALSLDAKEARA